MKEVQRKRCKIVLISRFDLFWTDRHKAALHASELCSQSAEHLMLSEAGLESRSAGCEVPEQRH